jgi:hypothetical protein
MSKDCEKCITKPKVKGLCKAHYEKKRQARNPPCSVPGCHRRQSYVKLALCLAHFQASPQGQNQKLKSKYGIGLVEFNQMMYEQNGNCAICKKPESRNQRLSVDHDHKTQEVRGLLCFACNAALGFFQDNPQILENAKQYLKKKGK